VSLGANATLNGNGVTFESSVNGSYSLTVNDSGASAFRGEVGATPLSSLSVTSAGGVNISAAVNTTGAQTYEGAVTLGAAPISLVGTGITFGSTINGGFALALNDAGASTFGGAVGGQTKLTSLSVTSADGTNINGGAVKTTGAQTYNSAVTLGADAALTGDGIDFASTVNGAHGLTVTDTGASAFGGAVGGLTPLSSLTVTSANGTNINGGAVTTSGAQTYNDAVTFGGAPGDITLTGQDVTWNGALTGTNFHILGTNLVMNGNINSSGSTGVIMDAGSTFENPNSHAIHLTGGGRFLIYSVAPTYDAFGGLTGSTQYGIGYPTPPLFAGNGFLFNNPTPFVSPQSQQGILANNVFASYATPMPSAATHGGEASSVIDTPTDTDVYRHSHKGSAQSDSAMRVGIKAESGLASLGLGK
jgi:hypothetical protein